MTSAAPDSRLVRVGKFGAVGILNTLLDFVIFNVMFGVFGLHVIAANIISTTIAMAFSFLANRNVVFKAQSGSPMKQVVLFLVVTAFGLYVLQLGIIHLLTGVWHAPLDLVVRIVDSLGLDKLFSERFIRNNGAKALATVVSLLWNYIMYRRVVFR